MEPITQVQTAPRTPSAKLSPLKQHPIASELPPSPDATRTIFLNHPSARWSSSPASSPRVVEPSPVRRGSVYPALMERGLDPGPDFFDEESSDSAWEDSDGDMTQTLSNAQGLGLSSLIPGIAKQTDNASRGRSRRRSGITALPPSKQPPARYSGLSIASQGKLSSPVDRNGGRRARPISVRRMSKDSVRVVHTSRGNTPRNSIRSSTSVTDATFADAPRHIIDASVAHAGLSKAESVVGRHRRNTSESILAGSIIDAHVMTMRALESLNLSPSSILLDSNNQLFSKRKSFTDERRHIKLSPLPLKEVEDHDRPAHLPAHFVRTPYPFSAKKEFPKPQNRPRSHGLSERPLSSDTEGFIRLDSGYGEDMENREYDDRKGKHVLGLMASEGEYDLRSRLERNQDEQGIIRSRAGSGRERGESTVWLSLERRSRRRTANTAPQPRQLVKLVVPSSLTTSSPDPEKKKHPKNGTVDFDDAFLARRLRAAHAELAGNIFRRTFSARTLRYIGIGNVKCWSGHSPSTSPTTITSGLLAIGAGTDMESSPFTENSLMKLYRTPASGKARYTWVHWARRVSSVNCQHAAGSQDDTTVSERLATVQFVHTISVPRILCALSLMLLLSIAAALLWVFLGPGGTGWRTAMERQRSDRVGGGMGVGILVLLLEGVGFGAWVWLS